MHAEQHPLSGKTVKLKEGVKVYEAFSNRIIEPKEYELEDWYDRVAGSSWMVMEGNPAALGYAMRSGLKGLPTDDEVVYGHINGFGHLIHVSEIVEEQV